MTISGGRLQRDDGHVPQETGRVLPGSGESTQESVCPLRVTPYSLIHPFIHAFTQSNACLIHSSSSSSILIFLFIPSFIFTSSLFSIIYHCFFFFLSFLFPQQISILCGSFETCTSLILYLISKDSFGCCANLIFPFTAIFLFSTDLP